MPDIGDLFEADDEGVVIAVSAVPGAGRSEIVGRHGDALKVRVAVPPEKGKANEAIVALLAHELGVPASTVSLVSGATGRAKRFRVDGVDVDTATDLLEGIVAANGRRGPAGKGFR